MCEDTTAEKAAELALDEAGQPDPVGARGGRGEEGLQMLPDHPVQDRVGGSAWDVGSHGARPSGFRALAATRPQDGRTTYTRGVQDVGAKHPAQPSVAKVPHLDPTQRWCGSFGRVGRSSPSPFSTPRDAQSHTGCVVPWTQPREPLEGRASPREAWFYGLARLRKVSARDPESCRRRRTCRTTRVATAGEAAPSRQELGKSPAPRPRCDGVDRRNLSQYKTFPTARP